MPRAAARVVGEVASRLRAVPRLQRARWPVRRVVGPRALRRRRDSPPASQRVGEQVNVVGVVAIRGVRPVRASRRQEGRPPPAGAASRGTVAVLPVDAVINPGPRSLPLGASTSRSPVGR